MKIFLDTSSLFKLYHKEKDSGVVESIFTDFTVTDVFLSEICKIEFSSTVWKKVRIHDISEQQATTLLEAFEDDFAKYIFVQIDPMVIEQARILMTIHGKQGLRTLDSIQLSTAVLLKGKVHLFMSSDNLLNSFFKLESIPTEKPAR